ncbi:hypothetical protein KIH75_09815, partial [Bifidobacterium sp. 64T4]|uniref:hypothetical protein n=1 Tax=Bifidobacterium pongonis TaxID=2834432 RepID=UPI001C560F71
PSPGFQSRFFVLANENRTQDAGHALLRQGRNPKVRKISDVIHMVVIHIQETLLFRRLPNLLAKRRSAEACEHAGQPVILRA